MSPAVTAGPEQAVEAGPMMAEASRRLITTLSTIQYWR